MHSHHLREVEWLNNHLFELQQRSEALAALEVPEVLEALRDNEIEAHACPSEQLLAAKRKVASFGWLSATKAQQVAKISKWNKMYASKLAMKRADLKKAYARIKV
jgi:hypothetical protein